ncbi:MAG: prepilin peptidase [Chloroflexi bacterium]|nr:prepilin peptidase [Chloroflexota bacterium]
MSARMVRQDHHERTNCHFHTLWCSDAVGAWEIPLLILFVLLGLAVGSFLNVCSDRLPAGESIVRGSSHCDACQRPLSPVDLVPVLSYLWLRGRCRYCGAPIPPRVPLVEAATGAIFGFLYWEFGLGVELAVLLAYASILVVIFVIDMEHQLILNVVVYPAMPLALALSFLWPDPTPLSAMLGWAVGVGLVTLPFLLYRQGMGMGDIKLGGLIGLMAGYPHVLVALLLSVIGGGLVGSVLLLLRIKGRRDAIPFGPFMATAAFVTLLWGKAILDWYPPAL